MCACQAQRIVDDGEHGLGQIGEQHLSARIRSVNSQHAGHPAKARVHALFKEALQKSAFFDGREVFSRLVFADDSLRGATVGQVLHACEHGQDSLMAGAQAAESIDQLIAGLMRPDRGPRPNKNRHLVATGPADIRAKIFEMPVAKALLAPGRPAARVDVSCIEKDRAGDQQRRRGALCCCCHRRRGIKPVRLAVSGARNWGSGSPTTRTR